MFVCYILLLLELHSFNKVSSGDAGSLFIKFFFFFLYIYHVFFLYACTHTLTCMLHTRTHARTHARTHIHTHTHTLTHSHTRTYTHTHRVTLTESHTHTHCNEMFICRRRALIVALLTVLPEYRISMTRRVHFSFLFSPNRCTFV